MNNTPCWHNESILVQQCHAVPTQTRNRIPWEQCKHVLKGYKGNTKKKNFTRTLTRTIQKNTAPKIILSSTPPTKPSLSTNALANDLKPITNTSLQETGVRYITSEQKEKKRKKKKQKYFAPCSALSLSTLNNTATSTISPPSSQAVPQPKQREHTAWSNNH